MERLLMLTLIGSLLCGLCQAAPAAGQSVVRFDFESGDMQGFTVMDGEFGLTVCDRDMCRNAPDTKLNKQGKFFLTTLERADGSYNDGFTGVIESPVFVLTGPDVRFLVGGGGHEDTYVALCTLDGVEQFKASGSHSEMFREVKWDASKLVGKTVYIAVVDRNTGGFGHVTLDDFTAPGHIDDAATAQLRKSFAGREQARLEHEKKLAARRDEQRKKRLVELKSSKYLFERGRSRVYSGDNLTAISLVTGGIGAGCIQIDGRAMRPIWQIFNNYNSFSVPDSFFALRVKTKNGEVTRALQTQAAGAFPAMQSLTFRGEYPFGWYDFKDSKLPVRVSMETYSPMVPLDVKDSAIPCAVYTFTVTNPTDSAVDVSVIGTQQNAVGYTGKQEIKGDCSAEYGGNINEIVRQPGVTVLHMSSNADPNAAGSGDMALAVLADDARGCAIWSDTASLVGGVSGPDKAGPSPSDKTINGALSATLELAPNESKAVTFVVTWYFPNCEHGEHQWGGEGNMYSNWWKSALDVASDTAKRMPELAKLTRLYHDTLYSSNLPRWMLDRVTSQTAILRSRTCFWTKEGYFGAYEGCGSTSGCCMGNCSHVWHYAHAHARLFPEIARTMREQEFDHETSDGGVRHRQTSGFEPAADGHFGAILGAYREYLAGTDRAWLDSQWSRVKLAIEYAIKTWDSDEDGVMAGRQWNTLDDALSGSSSWIGSLYLTSLAACEKMAIVEGDKDLAARCARIRLSGMKKQDATLFNGEYYFQIPGAEMLKDYGPGCHIDQVIGQWWAGQLDLGQIYPADHVRTALKSLVEYNFHADYFGFQQSPRKFVSDTDSALQMITWPRDGKPAADHLMFYGDEVMSGFEYAAAGAMIEEGLLQEGFMVARAIYDRYDGRLRTGLTPGDTASWGYSGNPFGDDECGKFYARAMSSWGLLVACQGFVYDGPAGVIGFKPKWQPENHVSFFTGAAGWGLYKQTRKGSLQTGRIEVAHGKLNVSKVVFELAPKAKPSAVEVKLGRKKLDASFEIEDGLITITLPEKVTVGEGEALVVAVRG